MSGLSWWIDDADGDPGVVGAARPLLVTGRALRDALARTWRLWVGASIIGGLLGAGVLLALPHPTSASTTLLMVHTQSGESAMDTDVNLLRTRAVASRVIADLDLRSTPEAFLSSMTVEPVNDQILSLKVSGPTGAAAVARANSLVDNFLGFRAEQLRSISDGLIEGYDKRISDLQAEVDAMTQEYERLSADSSPDEVRASDILAVRTTLGHQITLMQSAIEEARIQTEAAITATHVIDPAEPHPFGYRRQMVLFGASGAILGAAAVIGLVLLRTLTSDRLRQRRDVADALGVPVSVGVGPIPPRGLVGRSEAAVTSRIARLLHGHPVRWSDRRRRGNLEALVHGLESGLPARLPSGPPARGSQGRHAIGNQPAPTALGLVAVDRTDVAAVVLHTLGARMVERGIVVLLVDLSSTGALSRTGPARPLGLEGAVSAPRVHRPEGNPTLAHGPRRSGRRPTADGAELGELGAAWDEADVVLALVEVDPGMDLDIVSTWVTRLVPLVSAGRASGELLTTIAGLVRATGLEMPFALLEGADSSDQTLGHPSPISEDRGELAAVQSQ